MAFQLVQEFKFEKLQYSYDPRGDVLDISFGPPAPAIALQVEDWLAVRVRLNPPSLQGMTIVGFKKISERINRYAAKELPKRMRRLARVKISIAYDDQSDTLVMRWEEKTTFLHKLLNKLSFQRPGSPSVFEPLIRQTGSATSAVGQTLANVYVEKTVPFNEIAGIKILQYTKCGEAAVEGIFGAIIDTIFEPSREQDENVHLIANAVVARLDWRKLAAAAV
jgi:hypothetical protein